MSQIKPDIKIEVNFDHEESKLLSAIEVNVVETISKLIDQLGIPGRPVVTMHFAKKRVSHFVQVIINGNECSFHSELPAIVYSYVHDSQHGLTELSKWSKMSSEIWMTKSPQEDQSLITFISMLVGEILKISPSLLLGKEHLETYWQSLGLKDSIKNQRPEVLERLLDVFKEILELRVSIADKQSISEIINERWDSDDVGIDHLREKLIEKLSSEEVVIFIHKEYFRAITKEWPKKEGDLFGLMRDGLFYELGLRYPKFRITFSNALRPGVFHFKINDLLTPPITGLGTDECLVNDTVDRLTLLNIKGTSAVNPANGSECSIISIANDTVAKQAGLTTWDGLGYFVLCFSAVLKNYSKCFVNNDLVNDELDKLETAWPKLVEIVRNQYPIGAITKTLRLLISEELSIRNLRLILVAMLEKDYIATDPQKYIILDDRLPLRYLADNIIRDKPETIAEYTRSRMKEYISHKYTRGGNTLVVYLLDPAIEKILDASVRDAVPVSKEDYDKIIEAIRSEVEGLPATAQNPVLLTYSTIRSPFKEMIRQSFPRLAVVAYNELSPDMNIQPIARISFTS